MPFEICRHFLCNQDNFVIDPYEPISRIVLLAMGQLYACFNAGKLSMNEMGKIGRYRNSTVELLLCMPFKIWLRSEERGLSYDICMPHHSIHPCDNPYL